MVFSSSSLALYAPESFSRGKTPRPWDGWMELCIETGTVPEWMEGVLDDAVCRLCIESREDRRGHVCSLHLSQEVCMLGCPFDKGSGVSGASEIICHTHPQGPGASCWLHCVAMEAEWSEDCVLPPKDNSDFFWFVDIQWQVSVVTQVHSPTYYIYQISYFFPGINLWR